MGSHADVFFSPIMKENINKPKSTHMSNLQVIPGYYEYG